MELFDFMKETSNKEESRRASAIKQKLEGLPYRKYRTTGHMNGLLLSLGGFSNCVLHTYSWLLHNGQQEIVFRTKGGEK
jgi:hypothetical protein